MIEELLQLLRISSATGILSLSVIFLSTLQHVLYPIERRFISKESHASLWYAFLCCQQTFYGLFLQLLPALRCAQDFRASPHNVAQKSRCCGAWDRFVWSVARTTGSPGRRVDDLDRRSWGNDSGHSSLGDFEASRKGEDSDTMKSRRGSDGSWDRSRRCQVVGLR
eukprot:759457-Hanusia_phi.AAC.2